jgi:2,3-bisphosphoglycerate-independent phosphoglycerate mutase
MISKPVVLVIMDGWGVTAPSVGNAVTGANLKYWDYLLEHYPSSLLQASGAAVGLPWGKMGNSEVGHLTIGAGQIYLQSLEKINHEISKGDFYNNQALLKGINHVKNNNSNLHLIGLLGDGGVHAHQGHLSALLELVTKNNLNNNSYLHLFLDGRDTPRDSGLIFMQELLENINKLNCCQVASLSGRFFGMDRNKNWDRVEKSYQVMVGKSKSMAQDPIQAIKDSYTKQIYDEEFVPVSIVKNNQPVGKVSDNDAVIFFNFRADRARQLTRVFVADDFKEFDRGKKFENLLFVTFTEYEKDLPTEVAFPKPEIDYPLARIVSENNLKQLHIAETEKYAHVTFFINGLKEEAFSGEERILIPSPMVESYDQQPEMSALQIRDKVVLALENDKFDFLIINFANPDMVGHTGNLEAGKRAVEITSQCVESVIETVLKKKGSAVITADHGNVEEMIDLETGAIDKQHSNFPVPVVLVREEYKDKAKPKKNIELHNTKTKGALVDVAPTILAMMGLDKHEGMIGIDLNKTIL